MLSGCAKKIRLNYRPISPPLCHSVVDGFYEDFRQPTPHEFLDVLECVEKLRAGYKNN